MKECQVRVSIWAVNGCQSEVLVIGKFKFDCQGFVVGYDIEITISKFFVDNKALFYKEGNTSSLASSTVVSDSIITRDSEIELLAKKRFI